MMTQWQNEFELHARAILGLPVSTALRNPGASAVIYGGLDTASISYGNLEQALAVPGSELRLFGKPEAFQKRRMGVALAQAEDVEVARQRARQAAAAVQTSA